MNINNFVLTESQMDIVERLHNINASCIIHSSEGEFIGYERGVIDILNVLLDTSLLLKDAFVADKVVGLGAAVLMIKGGIKRLHADVISKPAIEALVSEDIEVNYDKIVDNIINRKGDGICPIENLCLQNSSMESRIEAIKRFFNR